MKQILDGWIRHAVSSGGAALAVNQYKSGDKAGAVIGAVISLLGFIQSARHKSGSSVEGRTSSAGPAMPVAGLALCVAVATLSGCATSPIPSNRITGAIGGVPFTIEAHKQTLAENIELEVDSVTAVSTNRSRLVIGKLSSTNDPQVIDKSYAGQARVIEAQTQFAKEIVNSIGTATGNAGGSAARTAATGTPTR